MRKVLIITLLVCAAPAAFSQYMEAGFFGGGTYYTGDVSPNQPFTGTNPGYGAVFRYNLDNRLAARAGVYRGKITGNEAEQQIRPFREANFEGNVLDFTVLGEFNFLKYMTGGTKDKLSPYLFGGVGYHLYSGSYNVLDGQSADYSGSGFSIPFGLGVKYSLSRNIGLSAEWGYRKTFEDDLDGMGEFYSTDPNHDLYMVQMSNAATNDWYSFAGLTLTLRLDVFSREVCRDLQRTR